jgi:hypothetical protein
LLSKRPPFADEGFRFIKALLIPPAGPGKCYLMLSGFVPRTELCAALALSPRLLEREKNVVGLADFCQNGWQ